MMRKTLLSLFLVPGFILVPALFLAACSSSPSPSHHHDGPLIPMPDFAASDPDDAALARAVERFLAENNGPASTRYEFARVDLDGDSRRDALVMMVGPHHYWCAMDGCNLVVFKAGNDDFSPVSEIYPVRGPLYVSNRDQSGWKDLIIRVSGQSYAKAKDVAMKFDGNSYPRNPFFEPAITPLPSDHGLRLFP